MSKKTKQAPANVPTNNNVSINHLYNPIISLFMQKNTWGIESLYHLMTNNCENIPKDKKGIYIILTSDRDFPGIITRVQAQKRYKFNVSEQKIEEKIAKAKTKWINDSYILFIGETKKEGLRLRIQNLINFGKGRTYDYCAALYVWLLKCLCHVLVLWIALPEGCDPILVRKHLLQDFEQSYGALPFANQRH